MATAGVKSTNVAPASVVDEIIANRTVDGVNQTVRIPVAALGTQIAEGAGAIVASKVKATFAQLDAIKGTMAEGDIGLVVFDANLALRGRYALEGGVLVRKGDLTETEAMQYADEAKAARDEAVLVAPSTWMALRDETVVAKSSAELAEAGSVAAKVDAETAAGAIQAIVGIFADTTAGISGTNDGDFFAVPSPDDDESFLLYEKDGGSAVAYKAYPSSAALTDAFGRGRGKTELVALAKTPAGKVPIWLDGGRFDTIGLGPRLSGAVLPAWSDGSGLAVLKGLLARKKYGDAVTAKLVVTGDSWAERQNIPQAMATKLYAMYGKGADGWLSPHGIGSDTLGPINGVVVARTGWTDHDITEEDESGAYGPDGLRLDATGTSATMSWTGITAETIKLYYLDTAGTFRYRTDGGSWTSVAGGNTGAPAKVTISGLNPATPHTLALDLTGNAGTVSIFGAYATGIAGVELSKMGNGEGLASDFLAIIGDAVPTYILADIAPHAAMVMLGTNDLSANVTPDDFATGIASITTAYLTASPTCGILLASPPRNGRTGFYSMEAYAWTSQAAASLNPQIEFFNFPAFWADYTAMNAVGLWNDIGHLNSAGAYALSHQIIDRFFTIS